MKDERIKYEEPQVIIKRVPKLPFSFTKTVSDTPERILLNSVGSFTGVVKCVTQNVKIGDKYNQNYLLAANDVINVEDIDLSKVYVKNASAGSAGTIYIFGGIG